MTDSIAAAGLRGLKNAQESAVKHAEQVSKAFTPQGEGDQDLVEGFVGLKEDVRNAQASAKVIKVADEMNDSILDIIA